MQYSSYGPEKLEKGIFDSFFDAAKDLGIAASEKMSKAGKAIATGTSEAGKFVVEKTSTAAKSAWEKGKTIAV